MFLSLILIASLTQSAAPQPNLFYTISTVAGTGEAGFSGDSGPAEKAQLNHPTAVDVDKDGNLYIADFSNSRIRKVDIHGVITTVAGNGKPGFGGDGGPATSGMLAGPYGVHAGASGAFYIGDQRNNRLRKVDANGLITTIAGNGKRDFAGDGGLATAAALVGVNDAIEDGHGNVIVADSGNNRIRKIDPAGNITTIVGNGIRRFSREGAYAGDGGPATKASISLPCNLVMDTQGDLIFTDFGNHAVRKVDPSGIITTICGTGGSGFNGDGLYATTARLNEPGGIALTPDGTLVIADGLNYRIRVVGPDGIIRSIAGVGKRAFGGDGGPGDEASLGVLDAIACGPKGEIYIADYSNHRIRKLTPVEVPAVPTDPHQLLWRMRTAYATLGKAHIEFRFGNDAAHQTPATIDITSPTVLSATFVAEVGKVTINSDGTLITINDPAQPTPTVCDCLPSILTRLFPGNLEVYSLWHWAAQLSTGPGKNMETSVLSVIPNKQWNGRNWIVLHEDAGGVNCDYYVDPATFLIWRTYQTDSTGAVAYDGWLTKLERR